MRLQYYTSAAVAVSLSVADAAVSVLCWWYCSPSSSSSLLWLWLLRLSSSLSLWRPSFLPLSHFLGYVMVGSVWSPACVCSMAMLFIFVAPLMPSISFNSVLVADMSMVMFLTGQSGFITLGILSYLVLCFDLSVLVVQRLFNGCSTVVQRLFGVAVGRNGFLILMCQLKNYRPWSAHHR